MLADNKESNMQICILRTKCHSSNISGNSKSNSDDSLMQRLEKLNGITETLNSEWTVSWTNCMLIIVMIQLAAQCLLKAYRNLTNKHSKTN